MEINGVGSMMPMMQSGNQVDRSAMQDKMSMMLEQMVSSGEDAQVSPMGQMMSMLSSMSSEGLDQMRDFRGQVAESVKGGEFDAEALAEQVPDELKAFAEENGIDLTAMITQMGDRIEQGGLMQGGRGMKQAGGMSPFMAQPDQSLSDLLEALMSSSGEEDEA